MSQTATDRVECAWCRAGNALGQTTCAVCGAPLDKANLVSESGWREAVGVLP